MPGACRKGQVAAVEVWCSNVWENVKKLEWAAEGLAVAKNMTAARGELSRPDLWAADLEEALGCWANVVRYHVVAMVGQTVLQQRHSYSA